MSGLGADPAHIAKHLNLTVEDLTRHYGKELDQGLDEANLQVARTFFDFATSGEHPQMTVLWMKMRANWSEAKTFTAEEDDSDLDLARQKLLKLLNRAHGE